MRCDRKKGTNSDTNLTNIKYNTKAIEKILKDNKIEKIFFTSRFVEKLFKKVFPNFSYQQSTVHHPQPTTNNLQPTTYLYTLPSPSPRYAKLTLSEKIKMYNKLLPKP